MKHDQISNLNQANFVLRHFVDLSSRLLPILDDLNRIKDPNEFDRLNKIKISQIFENYNFENKTSQLLMGSNILELIQRTYVDICISSKKLRKGQKNKMLRTFEHEHLRLKDNWTYVDMN